MQESKIHYNMVHLADFNEPYLSTTKILMNLEEVAKIQFQIAAGFHPFKRHASVNVQNYLFVSCKFQNCPFQTRGIDSRILTTASFFPRGNVSSSTFLRKKQDKILILLKRDKISKMKDICLGYVCTAYTQFILIGTVEF